MENYGRVTFQPVAQSQTMVDIYINYNPPAGILGDIGERMGIGRHFDNMLQEDLNNFATMVDMAPVNAQDPNWSEYLFHPESAAARGATTDRQDEMMSGPATRQDMRNERPVLDRDIVSEPDRTASADERNIPPEQIPPQNRPDGSQPQP